MKKFYFAVVVALLCSFSLIFFYVPEEVNQGVVQKIFYIHVSSAMTMYLGFFISFLAGIMYLIDRKIFWDEVGAACSEVGWIFCTAVLMTGPIWAKPIWGTWWTWEPRLTTTFLLWLLYSAYLFTRNALDDSPKKPMISAVLTIIAFIDVPLIHYSVKLWRGVHPTVVSTKGGLPPSMMTTLFICIISFFLFFLFLAIQRFRLEKYRNMVKSAMETRY